MEMLPRAHLVLAGETGPPAARSIAGLRRDLFATGGTSQPHQPDSCADHGRVASTLTRRLQSEDKGLDRTHRRTRAV